MGDGDGGEVPPTLSGSKGGVVGLRPGSGGSAGGVEAPSNGAVKVGVVGGSDSRDARSEAESIDVAATAAAAAPEEIAPGSTTLNVSGRKRRDAPGDSIQTGEKERRGGITAGTTTSRRAVGGGSGGGAVGGRLEGRLGLRNAGPAGDEGGSIPSAQRESKEATSYRIQNGAPKRMRLVASSGVVVSQVNRPGWRIGKERGRTFACGVKGEEKGGF